MAKAGDEYRELVGTVMAALDPGSAVKTEQWISGPDGERDMDVEVRSTLKEWQHGELEPNSFRLNITVIQSNLPNPPGATPKVDELIAESRVDAE